MSHPPSSSPRSVVPTLFAAAGLGLLASVLVQVSWWHPYCDAPEDGPGFYAFGFPFPYGQPTGVSSGDFTYLPHMHAVNVVLLTAIAYVLIRLLGGVPPLRRIRLPRAAGVALFLVAMLISVSLTVIGAHSRGSFFSRDDSYWSYRPRALALAAGHRPCDR